MLIPCEMVPQRHAASLACWTPAPRGHHDACKQGAAWQQCTRQPQSFAAAFTD